MRHIYVSNLDSPIRSTLSLLVDRERRYHSEKLHNSTKTHKSLLAKLSQPGMYVESIVVLDVNESDVLTETLIRTVDPTYSYSFPTGF